MNELQRDLVTKNYNLIYQCIKDLKAYPIEDFTGIASIGLCKAAMTYDSNKQIKFSTYATWCIKNHIINEFKKMNKNKQPTLLSYEHDMSEVELHKYSYEDEILLNLSIEELGNVLGKKSIILDMIMDGYTQTQIAKKINYSQPTISMVFNYIKSYLKN